MARQRHNAAFVVGSVLGGVAGAAAALWKAPQSGSELRAKVAERLGGSGGTSMNTTVPDDSPAPTSSKASKLRDIWNATTLPETRSFGRGSRVGGKVLSMVENATAPIVGVKLGETARQAGSRAVSSVRSVNRGATVPAAEPAPAAQPVTPESTGETSEAGVGHVASTEELVRPAVPVKTQSTTQATGPLAEFPELEADQRKE